MYGLGGGDVETDGKARTRRRECEMCLDLYRPSQRFLWLKDLQVSSSTAAAPLAYQAK